MVVELVVVELVVVELVVVELVVVELVVVELVVVELVVVELVVVEVVELVGCEQPTVTHSQSFADPVGSSGGPTAQSSQHKIQTPSRRIQTALSYATPNWQQFTGDKQEQVVVVVELVVVELVVELVVVEVVVVPAQGVQAISQSSVVAVEGARHGQDAAQESELFVHVPPVEPVHTQPPLHAPVVVVVLLVLLVLLV